jgi:succinoglycan biosynthesis protein ExoA
MHMVTVCGLSAKRRTDIADNSPGRSIRMRRRRAWKLNRKHAMPDGIAHADASRDAEAESTARFPFVSLIMPSYNEEAHIEACLRSLLDQDYPAERLEILVADGGSADKTREIVTKIAASDRRVRLLDNSEHRIQSYGKNLALKEARGEFLLIADVHAEYASNYVSKLVEVFLATGADAAGGAQRAKASTKFQQALTAALDSPMGVGGAAYRSADREGWVDTVFPGAFRRTILEKVGLYDVKAVTNETPNCFSAFLKPAEKCI